MFAAEWLQLPYSHWLVCGAGAHGIPIGVYFLFLLPMPLYGRVALSVLYTIAFVFLICCFICLRDFAETAQHWG
jgi:hypothetical protein